jgi:hypothetical protein
LLMASELAASFGMDFMQALHNAGVGMLLHLAWLSAGPAALTAYLTAAILAGIVARMSRRHI